MKAFVAFLWSEKDELSAWSWNLNKQKLIEWIQSEYLNGIIILKAQINAISRTTYINKPA